MKPDIPALTGLRFVAAFSVLLAHALPKLFPIPEGSAAPLIYGILQSAASFGMSLFFVLSGFVIHYNYSEKIDRDGYAKFFVARFARLYPLYIVCILWELTIKFGHSQVSASLLALPFYLTMTQSWVYVVDEKNAIIFQLGLIASVAWSISTEFFFYCVYPVIRTRLKQLTSINQLLGAAFVTGAVVIGFLVIITFFWGPINTFAVSVWGPIADASNSNKDSFLTWLIYFSPYLRVSEFIIGCICAAIYLRRPEANKLSIGNDNGSALTYAAIAFTLVSYLLFSFAILDVAYLGPLGGLRGVFGMAPSVALLIFCLARYRSAVATLLSQPRIVMCGDASYSIYLLHLPVIFAFRWEAVPIFSPAAIAANFMRFGLMTLSIIGLSIVTYTMIEMPARRWIRTRFQGLSYRGNVRKPAD